MKLRTLLSVAVLACAFAVYAAADEAALVGTWTVQMAPGGGGGRQGGGGGGGGGEGRRGGGPQTITFKMDGGNLTGTMSAMGNDMALGDLKVDGDNVSFSVTREMNGNSMVMKYSGTLSGDTIKGTMDNGRGSPRDFTMTHSQ